MNVSEHCKERYVERIKGFTDKMEIRQYLVDNGDRIVDYILKMFGYATFIFKGQINGDKSSRNFYVKDDTVFVTDTADSCVITLYKVDFGFPEDTTKTVIKDLMAELEIINEKMVAEKATIDDFIVNKQYEIETIDAEMKNLMAQYDLLKSKKQFAADEIANRSTDYQLLNKKAEHYATLICNSMAFRNDVSRNMK